MPSRSNPAPIRRSPRLFLLASLLASASMTASCASLAGLFAGRPPANQVVSAAPPRLEVPADARQRCNLSITGPTIADLAVAYRMRGVDVAECDGRRELAVRTIDEEHRLEEAHAAAREERNRPFWKKLTPWREK